MLNEALYKVLVRLGAEPPEAEEAAKMDRQFAEVKDLIFQLHRIEAENSDRLTAVEADIKSLKEDVVELRSDVRDIRQRQIENVERLTVVESGVAKISQRQDTMDAKLDTVVNLLRDHVVPELKTVRPED